ncbi:hypothetical protein SUGI_0841660 [Cryptomeria japonica]|nr:hypothetical protein SUGI_0841660 [Cryptomeria japonica]
MQTTALLRFPSSSSLSSHPSSKFSSYPLHKIKCSSASSNVEINDGKLLSAKDRRKMRNERREEAISSKPPWREVVEERLLATPKMPNLRYLLNLDTLAEEGVSWWTLCVRKTSERSAAKNLFIEFRRQYPDAELEIFVPEVPFRKEMKDGSYSKRMKILFPGYIFIKCLLNKEIHDLIRYSPSIRGFSGTKVGNSTRWIMRPNPISNAKIEEMLKRVNEEKEKCSQEIEDELLKEKRNKKKDNLVRQEHTEAITHKDFSIAKNANFRTDLAKELNLKVPAERSYAYDFWDGIPLDSKIYEL